MLLGIDHLVIAVADPDAAADDLEATLGLAVTGGGRHEGRGTFNRLAFLGDTYLELIGVYDRALVGAADAFAVGQAALRLLDEGREGLATYALATDDAVAEVARLRVTGSPIGDAVAGSRARPDGELVRWVSAFPALGPDRPPFLIEHEAAGSEWGPEARAARAAFRHPAGGIVRLTGLALPSASPTETAARYREVLGIESGPDWRVTLGDQAITFEPAGGSTMVGVPLVALEADADSVPVDVVRFGIRWRRTPRAASRQG